MGSDDIGVLSFRSICKYDVMKLQSLYEECFPVSYPSSWFQDLLDNSSLISIAAVSGDDLVGILVGTVTTLGNCSADDYKLLASSFPLSTGVAYILSLGVTSSFRSRGVASILLRSFIGYVSGENMDWLNDSNHQVDLSCSDLFSQTVNGNLDHYRNGEHCYSDSNVSTECSDTSPSTIWRVKDYKSLYNLITQLPHVSPVRAVYLHVLHSNLHARRFYENRGFICLHVRPGCYTIDGRSADGCTYVLHTNGGHLDCKPINCNLNTLYEYFNDYSVVCYLRWMIRLFSQSGYTILYKLRRFSHYLYDTPSTFLHSYIHNNQKQEYINHLPFSSSSYPISSCLPQHFTEYSIPDTASTSSSCISSDSPVLNHK
uniref:N-alpha-acetyltransferase 60 n=1 Tax=Schistosoma mansoni TaxID=6183 RepID=A0A5K4F272_SCHMA